MRPFTYGVARDLGEAASAGREAGAAFVAGGTTLLDLMKLEVLRPTRLVDLGSLPLLGIDVGPDGLRLGALERMSDVAAHADVVAHYPVVSEALLASASPQLRNMATLGGNLLQRTRCSYYRDLASPCNRRSPGSGCPAVDGENRGHALFGGSAQCVATHPSDLAVALVALDASVRIVGGGAGAGGERTVRLEELYPLPGETPEREHQLAPGELIAAIEVPPLPWASRSRYVKVRDRASFEFALVSVAVALDLDGGRVREARVAAGGVGTRPWRLPAVEAALRGRPAGVPSYEAAAEESGKGAKALSQNGYKVELLRRTIVKALLAAGPGGSSAPAAPRQGGGAA
jgi:xanthine dehydrogenase YagS FAD-binding subunit